MPIIGSCIKSMIIIVVLIIVVIVFAVVVIVIIVADAVSVALLVRFQYL